jgi:GNAT superfamily N-acetyltransferase
VDGPARRVDAASGRAHLRWLELLGEPLGVRTRVDGAVVATAATAEPEVQWLQHVTGATPADVDLVGDLLRWYRELAVRPRFELAPADGFGVLAGVLHDGGARHVGFTDLLVGQPTAPGERPHAPQVRIRRLAPDVPDDLFAATLLGGHEVPADASEAHWVAAARFPTLDGYACYVAEDAGNGAPLGAAVLTTVDGVGLLANASTLPAARGRGVQAALIARRIADAYEAGCDVIGALALPWSSSQRNLRRAGLAVACTKVDWVVA